jgi:hypothetical protein
MIASHAWHVADIVSSVVAKSGPNGQVFQRKSSTADAISFRTEDAGKHVFHLLVCLV